METSTPSPVSAANANSAPTVEKALPTAISLEPTEISLDDSSLH